jgi:hypothetical protein
MEFRMNKVRSQKVRAESGAAQIVEFGAAFYLIMIFVVFFLFGTVSFILSASVGEVATVTGATQAANASAYDTALRRAVEGVTTVFKSGIGRLANLQPVAGYDHSGANLLIDVTDKKSGKVQSVGPNAPLNAPANPEKYFYSYRLISKFSIGPLIKGCPATISYVTQPVTLTFSAERTVEHPDALDISITKAKPLD